MKTIGLIGGMSWESTVEYYRLLNQGIKAQLGGLHSARVLLYSVDFAEVAEKQHAGLWAEAGAIMADAAQRLTAGGADFLLLCTNTMHKVADAITGAPLLHIADATAAAVKAAGIRRVGLLGTAFTMEDSFFRDRLADKFGLDVIIPEEADRQVIHRVIYDELCLGIIREESRVAYREAMHRLEERGAEGIILGCTEIGLLVRAEDSRVPQFDTTRLHTEAAVAMALAD